MPVFDLVTTDDNTETVASIMQRAIGATSDQVGVAIVQVEIGGPTPNLLINGVNNGQTIPDDMLAMYRQFYIQSVSIPAKTGFSYSRSLSGNTFSLATPIPQLPENPVDNAFALITIGNGSPVSTVGWGIYIDTTSGDLWISSVANAFALITEGNGSPSGSGSSGSVYIDLITGDFWIWL